MSIRPPSGTMVYWRFRAKAPCEWVFGYVTILNDGMLRMDTHNGDSIGGTVVRESEIEWVKYG